MSCAHCRETFLFVEVGLAANQTLQPRTRDRAHEKGHTRPRKLNPSSGFADIEIEFKKIANGPVSPKTRAFRMDSVGLTEERGHGQEMSAWKNSSITALPQKGRPPRLPRVVA